MIVVDSLKVMKTAAHLMGSGFFGIGANLIIIGLLTRSLSGEDFGVWSILLSLFSLLFFLDLGFGTSLRNRISEHNAAGGNGSETKRLFFGLLKLYIYIALFVVVITVVIVSMFSYEGPFGKAYQNYALLVVLLASALNIPLSVSGMAFYAFLEAQINALGNISISIIRLMGVAVGFVLGFHLVGFVLLFYFGYIAILFLYLFVFLNRRGWKISEVRCAKLAPVKQLIKPSIKFGILQAANLSIASTDVIIVGYISSTSDAGDFALAQKFFVLIVGMHLLAMQSYWSAYTISYQRGDFAWVRETLKKTLVGSMAICLTLSTGILFFGGDAIRLWTGKEIDDPFLFLALSLWCCVSVIVNHYSFVLNGIGKLNRQTVWLVVGAIANIPLSLVVGGVLGTKGVVLGSLIAFIPIAINNIHEVNSALKEKALDDVRRTA